MSGQKLVSSIQPKFEGSNKSTSLDLGPVGDSPGEKDNPYS